ncbi:MAG TPA: hypothetical protein VF575_02020 [Candidatus Saccharimonadales bacterium]|jgi:hypothetical protein
MFRASHEKSVQNARDSIQRRFAASTVLSRISVGTGLLTGAVGQALPMADRSEAMTVVGIVAGMAVGLIGDRTQADWWSSRQISNLAHIRNPDSSENGQYISVLSIEGDALIEKEQLDPQTLHVSPYDDPRERPLMTAILPISGFCTGVTADIVYRAEATGGLLPMFIGGLVVSVAATAMFEHQAEKDIAGSRDSYLRRLDNIEGGIGFGTPE